MLMMGFKGVLAGFILLGFRNDRPEVHNAKSCSLLN